MSYEPDRYVIDGRRIGTSYLLAAIVLAAVFVQCFPNSAAGDRVAQDVGAPVVVVAPGRHDDDASVAAGLAADEDMSGSGMNRARTTLCAGAVERVVVSPL
ncbi:hypothetical protein AncyloWKF20_15575 [Ancylobacter sp. WKF20]|uniref:hypothetical protein n=1 Tax=Ancylobacter sp. WKF20 TaxID=3039801 RepID=UPI002434111D|nr:hypothetical protein [Ancylobacter sp. WKF20]WGD29190.1 hypothetical protein AncyloWKF20_15575 [Ancylobacter sp. WKF20]